MVSEFTETCPATKGNEEGNWSFNLIISWPGICEGLTIRDPIFDYSFDNFIQRASMGLSVMPWQQVI